MILIKIWKKKLIKKNNNEYNKDGDELSYAKKNEINRTNINNEYNNDNEEDQVNLEIKNNLTHIDEIYNKYNNNKNHDNNQKLNKNMNYNYVGLDENSDDKNFLPNLNNKGINKDKDKDKDDDIPKKLNNNTLVSPKRVLLKTNYNILKPINILKTKNHKVPNSAFPTPNSKKSDLPSNSRITNLTKIKNKLTGITSPSKISEKRLFNDSNLTNIRKIKNEEKKNRNRSLVNLISHKDNNINNIIHNKEHNNIDNYCDHLNEDLKSNSKKKYSRHFGNEDNCPICVALQMKNKLLEEKNKMLPILTKNNFRNNNKEEINNKSPNKDKIIKTIIPRNKEKKLIRIGSGTSILSRKHKNRRNESVKQIRKIEITNNSPNKNEEELFPVIKDYFNWKIKNIIYINEI